MYRVVLKKTKVLTKGTAKGGKSTLRRYLQSYVDERGKARSVAKESKADREGVHKDEPRWLLPEEKTGKLTLGGFLGDEESPGDNEPNKQRGWIRKVARIWGDALDGRRKRKSDGVRLVLSMGPEAVAQLTAAKIGIDNALGEIWKTTMELYRERHGWDNPEDALAWIWGAHHDTDNTHIHVVLFPTTKSGKALRTSYRTKEKRNDLADWIGMANIATELYWREHLPLWAQREEYQIAIERDPDGEPPLPNMEDFGRRGGGTKKEAVTIEPPKGKDAADYNEGEVVKLLRRRGRGNRGLKRLRALAIADNLFKEKLWKGKPWPVTDTFWVGRKNTGELAEQIKAVAPEEWNKAAEIINSLKGLFVRGRNKKFIEEIAKSEDEQARLAIELTLGMGVEPTEEDLRKVAYHEGSNFDRSAKAQGKMEQIENGALGLDKAVAQCQEREARLRAIGRKAKRSKGTLGEIISTILQGASLLRQILSASRAKAKGLVERVDGELRKKSGQREWTIEPNGVKKKVSEGPMYPEHLDPETILLPLEAGELKREPRKKKKLDLEKKETTKDEESHPLKNLSIRREQRRIRRREQARKAAKEGLEDPNN